MNRRDRLIIGISGASGALIGLRCLELLSSISDIESHLVVTQTGERTLALEVGEGALEKARALADITHLCDDVGASIASGSFDCSGMLIAPCSMRTLSSIAYGITDNLMTRAADVTLKERRKMVLVARETPLHAGHLEAMLKVTNLGAIVLPPVPAFYTRPKTVDEVVTQIAARALDLAGVDMSGVLKRWCGDEHAAG